MLHKYHHYYTMVVCIKSGYKGTYNEYISTLITTFSSHVGSESKFCKTAFKKRMHFKHKFISFSNLRLFLSGQFWVHDVLKNKYFCLRKKNPVLSVWVVKYTYERTQCTLHCWIYFCDLRAGNHKASITISTIFEIYRL